MNQIILIFHHIECKRTDLQFFLLKISYLVIHAYDNSKSVHQYDVNKLTLNKGGMSNVVISSSRITDKNCRITCMLVMIKQIYERTED